MKTIAETKFIGNQALICSPIPFNLEDGEYLVSIEPKKKKRSLDQNRLFWKLVGEIAKKEDGDLRNVDDLYTYLLQMSGAKYEVFNVKHEALEGVKRIYKHVRVVKQKEVRGCLWDVCFVFYGSSTFDTKEMSQLIDTTLNYAMEIGVDNVNDYWKEVLND